MNKQPVPEAVIADLYRLFGEGRLEETFALMDPSVVLVEPGDPEVIPWAGRFEGHEGLRRFYEGLAAGLTDVAIESESLELRPVGDTQVLATGIERGVAAVTAKSYETHSAWLWTVRDGRIVELQAYHDTAAMMEALTA